MKKLTGAFLTLLLFFCTSEAFSQRQIKGANGRLDIINSTTNDTIKIDVTGPVFRIINTDGALEVSDLTTTQRDALTASAGMIINNTTDSQIQGFDGTSWLDLGGAGGGATTFLGLTDTPASYAGQGGNFVKVNVGATALEFVASSVTPHAILSATHNDAATSTVVRGDIITGQTATPQWDRLALGASGTILRSNGTDLAYTTATWPTTTTINQILFSSATNTVAGLATANNGILITSAGGVPSISSTIPNATQDNITRLGTISTAVSPTGIWTFRDNNIQINNPANTFQYIFGTAALVADRTVELPLLTGNDTFTFNAFAATLTNKTIAAGSNTITGIVDANIDAHTSTKITITAKGQLNSALVYNDQANTFGAFAQRFDDDNFQLDNPANTFQYIFNTNAIVADRIVTLPLLTAGDTFTFNAFAATLTNKSIDSDNNTITNIVNADVKAAAGIVYSKLTFSNNIVAGDIATDAVANVELADMVQNAIKLRVASGTGDPEDIINTGLTTVTGVSGDFVIIWDADDSFNLKKVNASDFLGGSVAWEGIADAGAAGEILFADFNQDMTWDTPATATATDAFRFRWTHDATTDGLTQKLLTLERSAAGAGTHPLENLLYIVNADDQLVDTGIEIIGTSTGAITNALLLSDAEIVNWASIGTNNLVTAGGTITSVELDRLTGLAGIIATDVTSVTNLDGTNLSISAGTLNVDDAFVINSGSDIMAGTLTADGLTLGANENITLGAQTLDHDGTNFVFNDDVQATGFFQDGDVADAGIIRLQNNVAIAWEAAPAGTDLTLLVNASEVFVVSVDFTVPDEAYDATNWNGSLEVPTKNAVRDKLEDIFKVERYIAGFANPDAGDLAAMAALATFDNTTNDVSWEGLAADAATDEFVTFVIPMPENWDGTTNPEFQLTAFTRTVDGTDNVVWQLQAAYVRPGTDVFTGAYGTAVSVTDTYGTVDRPERSGTFAPTPAGTAAVNAWLFIRINRDADNASDNLSVDIILTALFMEYAADSWPTTSQF